MAKVPRQSDGFDIRVSNDTASLYCKACEESWIVCLLGCEDTDIVTLGDAIAISRKHVCTK